MNVVRVIWMAPVLVGLVAAPMAFADDHAEKQVRVVVCTPEGGAPGCKVQSEANGDQNAHAVSVLACAVPAIGASTLPVCVTSATASEPSGGAWLGIQCAEVPAPLVAQLGLSEGTVMVANVVKDSPADQAGLQQWDIITAVDDEAITSGTPDLVDSLRAKGPEGTVTLTVLRGGKEQTLNATLATWPGEIKPEDYKYERSPEQVIREQVCTTPFMIKKDDQGHWTIKSPGDLRLDLPEEIMKFIPKFDTRTTRVFVGDEHATVKIHVQRDGESIDIEQENGGEITVRRTTKKGDTETVTEETYKDADALQEGDPEAYELYSGAQESRTDKLGWSPGIAIDLSGSLGQHDWDQWRRELSDNLREAQRRYQEAVEQAQQQAGALRWFARPDLTGNVPSFDRAFTVPTYTFRVDENGKIEVTVRKGDAQIIKTYKDEDDLKARDAELYERFRSTRTASEE
jgi:hypothetical protein